MGYCVKVSPQPDGSCFGYAVLKIDAVPGNISRQIPERIFHACEAGKLSCEVCFSTAGAENTTEIFLILRGIRESGQDLFGELSSYVQIILDTLKAAGFLAHAVCEDSEADPVCKFFNGELSMQSRGCYFYPADEVYDFCYIPGSYSNISGKLDLKGILDVLRIHRNCMLCWQLKDIVIDDTERKIVSDHLAFFKGKTDSLSVRATEALLRKQQAMNRPAVRAHWYAAGTVEFRKHLQIYMNAAGMHSHYSSRNFFLPRADYLYSGCYLLLDELRLIAEDLIRGQRAHAPWRYFYLTHITDYQTALQSISFPLSLAGSQGIKINSEPNALLSLPGELRDPNGIFIGNHITDNSAVYLPVRELSKHGFITGKSGMGKTTCAMGLLYRFAQKGLPFLVIEPTKTEYRALLHTEQFRKGGLQVFTPGDARTSPISLNMFMPPRGVHLEEYKPHLRELFRMGVSSSAFVSSILADVIDYCYTEFGWRDSSTIDSIGVRKFGMREFICKYREYVRYNVLDQESRNNVENSGIMRFQEMLANNAFLFDTNAVPNYEKMLTTPTVIELDALGNDYLKCLVTGIILINLSLVIHKRGNQDGTPRNVLFIDEAHQLLSPKQHGYSEEMADPCSYNVKLLQQMTQELRAYGLCLFFGDQKPAKLTRDIAGGVSTKLILRLDDREDMNLAADVAHMSREAANTLPHLEIGEGYLQCGNMSSPVRITIPNTKKELHLPNDVPDEDVADYMDSTLEPPYAQCTGCGRCDIQFRQDASFLAKKIANSKSLREILSDSSRSGELVELVNNGLEQKIIEIADEDDRISKKLIRCVRAHLVRLLLTDGNCSLTEPQLLGKQALTEPAKKQESDWDSGQYPSFLRN